MRHIRPHRPFLPPGAPLTMNEQALRVALRQPEAWATLTDHQSRVVRLFIDRRSVSQVARDLGVSRQAVLDALRLAGNKFREFAKRVSD